MPCLLLWAPIISQCLSYFQILSNVSGMQRRFALDYALATCQVRSQPMPHLRVQRLTFAERNSCFPRSEVAPKSRSATI